MTADNMDQPSLLVKAYPYYNAGQYLQSAVLLIFRLAFGWEMYLSGYGHLTDPETMVHRFQKWGAPFPGASVGFIRFNVYISGGTEVVCGALLMVGLATRLISIPLIFNFLVAIMTAGRLKVQQALFGGSLLSTDDYNPGHLGGLQAIIDDTAFPFLTASLLAAAFGAGKVSLDYLIYRLVFRRRNPQPPSAPASPQG